MRYGHWILIIFTSLSTFAHAAEPSEHVLKPTLSVCSIHLTATQATRQTTNLKVGDIFVTLVDRSGYPGAHGKVLLAQVTGISDESLEYKRDGIISGILWPNMSPTWTRNLSRLVGHDVSIQMTDNQILEGSVLEVSEMGITIRFQPFSLITVRWDLIVAQSLVSKEMRAPLGPKTGGPQTEW